MVNSIDDWKRFSSPKYVNTGTFNSTFLKGSIKRKCVVGILVVDGTNKVPVYVKEVSM